MPARRRPYDIATGTPACAAALLFIAACGADARAPRGETPPHASVARAHVDASAPDAAAPDASVAPLDAARLAARGASLAPAMREAARVDADAPVDRDLVRDADRDVCARVAFTAAAPVRVTLLNGAGEPLVELPPAASGIAGTACVRKGDGVALRIAPTADGGITRVHAVAWVSP